MLTPTALVQGERRVGPREDLRASILRVRGAEPHVTASCWNVFLALGRSPGNEAGVTHPCMTHLAV